MKAKKIFGLALVAVLAVGGLVVAPTNVEAKATYKEATAKYYSNNAEANQGTKWEMDYSTSHSYDKKGNITKRVTNDLDYGDYDYETGTYPNKQFVATTSTYSYKSGKLVKIVTKTKNTLVSTTKYTYLKGKNSKKLSTIKEYDAKNKLTRTTTYSYKKGKISKIVTKNAKGKKIHESLYNSKGKLTKTIYYNENGKKSDVSEYNSKGDITKSTSYESDGKTVNGTDKHTYKYKSGVVEKHTAEGTYYLFDEDDNRIGTKYKIVYTYYTSGYRKARLKDETHYNYDNGKYQSNTKYTYSYTQDKNSKKVASVICKAKSDYYNNHPVSKTTYTYKKIGK